MASLDFDQEKKAFGKFYDSNRELFQDAMKTFIRIISSILEDADVGEVTKIEGRVKDKKECIRKFKRKYRIHLEADELPYEIKDHLSDLIGIRIICLYEDQIEDVYNLLSERFEVTEFTDKTSEVENSKEVFGYKGLHMDICLTQEMRSMPKHKRHGNFSAEVQIRSLIQDAWSVLDHKIKYKKSIPYDLKRRINILSALFELADQEFKEIRNATNELVQQATVEPVGDIDRENRSPNRQSSRDKTLNAFNFLRVARHFFKEFEFEDHKIDDFVQDILTADNDFQKYQLHTCLIENLKNVRNYRDELVGFSPGKPLGPYTSIRHCLYLYDKKVFNRILSKSQKKLFETWLNSLNQRTTSAAANG